MAGAQAAAPAAAGAQQQEQPGIMARLGGIFRMILIFQVIKYVTSPSRPTQTDPVTGQVVPSRNHPPLWKQDASFDLFVYTSEEKDDFTDFRNPNSLLWEQRGLSYDWNIQREENITITTTEHLLNNGSLWAHVFFVKDGHSADPNSKFYDPTAVAYSKIQMNAYRPRPKVHAKKKLLSGEYTDDRLVTENKSPEEIAAQTEAAPEWISLWKPMLSVRLVHDFTTFPPNYWPPPLNDFYKIEPESNAYYPVIFIDYFWLLRERWMPINETTPTLPLELSYSPISLLKFQFQLQMEHTWSTQNSLGMGQTEEETQEFKRMLLDTNPYFLGLTMVVSLLHMVFDFLAFKNDIQFWREDRSMEGLSVRTIGLNCICQVIIFLYLLDNETSWMIILSSGVGLLIEFWKITKAMNVKIDPTKWYRISFEDKAGYEQSGTAEYDRQAMRYLSWALYPLVIGYAIYSLMYNEHKSWYSWLLGSLTGAVYTFGFIMMCPQLYLNYKLKSVAHLPWRMLTYKALNTFIDDLFAFIIKMPTLHRLSCFRDDVVFFIYLYQRWIYKTDYTRVNEFGMRLAGSNPLPHEEQDVVPLTDGELNDMKSKLPPKVLHLIAEFVPPVKAEGHPPAAAGPTPVGAKAEVAASSQGQTTVSKRAGRKTRKE